MSVMEFEDLAGRLCCAWLSYQLDLTYQHCMKTYIRDAEIGEYWYSLAKRLFREAP